MTSPSELRALWDYADPAGSEQRFRDRRAGTQDPHEVGVLTTQVARALGLQERYAEAHAELDRLAGHSGTGEIGLRVLLERGRLHRSAGDAASATTCFARAAEMGHAIGLPGLRVDALHMLALLPEDPAEQARRNREALAVARKCADPESSRWIAPLLNNLGMALHDAGDLEEALRAFEMALEVRRESRDAAEISIARWMVAWTLRLIGRSEEALIIQQGLARENAEADRQDPHVHDELSLLHRDRGEDEQAGWHRREAARLRAGRPVSR